jgi:ABC-2 type transport system permease protein
MWSWLGMVPVLLVLLIFTIAVSMILSALYPRFRDIGIIWAVSATALLYATPVLYPLQHASGTVGRLLALNPLAPLFELTRRWVIQPGAPIETGALELVVPIVIFLVVCVFAFWIFNREAPRVAEAL